MNSNNQGIFGRFASMWLSRDSDEASTSTSTEESAVIGGNFNGRPRVLNKHHQLLDHSETEWVRCFIDVRQKLDNEHHPKNDPDVVALRKAARDYDCNLIVSLKWDFSGSPWTDKEEMRVPEPGSPEEVDLRRGAARYLRNIKEPVDVVIMGNEPMWETLDEDIDTENPPVVRFMRHAKDHLVEHGDHGDPDYVIGAFNQIGRNRGPRHDYFNEAMLEWAREDEDITGLDIHVHYNDFSKAEQMVSDARKVACGGDIYVTEFSPVWRYNQHVNDPIGDSDAGEAFCNEYGYDPGMTAVEYFEHAKDDPRPQCELSKFYEAMPWYNTEHVARVQGLLDEYNVRVGGLGFLQGRGMRNVDWSSGWKPFHINFLYQAALIRGPVVDTAIPQYMEDYRRF